MLKAIQLPVMKTYFSMLNLLLYIPACIAHLDASLSDVDTDNFPHGGLGALDQRLGVGRASSAWSVLQSLVVLAPKERDQQPGPESPTDGKVSHTFLN